MSISLITWAEPTTEMWAQLRSEFPEEKVSTFPWEDLKRDLSDFRRRQNRERNAAIYFLCEDVNESVQIPYILALSMLFRARRKILIDRLGHVKTGAFALLLLRRIPKLLWDTILSSASLILFWIITLILQTKWCVNSWKVQIPEPQNGSRLKKMLYVWSYFPSSAVDLKVGGEISHIGGFLLGAKRLGYEVTLVTSRPFTHENETFDNYIIDEKRLPAWPGEIRYMTYNWKAFWQSRKLTRTFKPDVIYQRSSQFSIIGVLLSVLYRIPLIMEFNSSDVWESQVAGGDRFQSLLRCAESINLHYADRISVVSDVVGDYFRTQGVRSEKIRVNPNGVNPAFFKPSANGSCSKDESGISERITVGFLGVFAQYQGTSILAKSIKEIVRYCPNVHFLLIGDGVLRPKFEEIVRQDSMQSFVTMLGKVPHEKVPEYLNHCDILVSPHLDMPDGSTFLGSPTKIFEYMSMGKAIVASRVGQLAEIFSHEQTALLVPPGNPGKLAEAIVRLAQEPVLRESLGNNARAKVIAQYTWEKNVGHIMNPTLTER